MKLYNPSHPSDILLQYFLASPDLVVSSGKQILVTSLINNKTPITEEISDTLSSIFQSSKDYWLNLQKQWDSAQFPEDKPCPDMSINYDMHIGGPYGQVQDEGRPVRVNVVQHDPSVQVYILTEQAYKYMLSKCTEDEAWDLGWLGQSEKHAVSKGMPKKLKDLIKRDKKRNISKELSETLRSIKKEELINQEKFEKSRKKYSQKLKNSSFSLGLVQKYAN